MNTIKITNADLINLKNGVKNPAYDYLNQLDIPFIKDIYSNEALLKGTDYIEISWKDGITTYALHINHQMQTLDLVRFCNYQEDQDENQGSWTKQSAKVIVYTI